MAAQEITEDIFIECLTTDFPNFKVSKSNLTHPTSQFVSSYYALILRQMLDLDDPESIWNWTKDQKSYMSLHPESATFGHHVWANNLHAVVKYVFGQVGQVATKFVFSDILFPENTPKRSFVFMSMMLSIYWFSNEFAEDLSDDFSACVKEAQLIQNLNSDKEKLNNELYDIESQKSLYVESLKDIKKESKECSDRIDEKENVMKELMEKEEVLIKELEKEEEEEQKLQEALTKLQNEKKYLESLIVSNENQVVDIHEKQVAKKEEVVKKMNMLKQHAESAYSQLQQSKRIYELQQKRNSYLRDDIQNGQGENRGFQSLLQQMSSLNEKKSKLTEEESGFTTKVLEIEDVLLKLRKEFCQIASQEEDLLQVQKSKASDFAGLVENQGKVHSQLVSKIRSDSEKMETSHFVEINGKCEELEEKIQSLDADFTEKYLEQAQEMAEALQLINNLV